MKNFTFIIILFLIPFCGVSQTKKPIDSFFGIKFRSSYEIVKDSMIARSGHLDTVKSKPDFLFFEDVKQDGSTAGVVTVKFVNNMAYEAGFVYRPDFESKIIDYYADLVNNLNALYGDSKIIRNFKPPYTDGDYIQLKALRAGQGYYYNIWTGANKNQIITAIRRGPDVDATLYIMMIYSDGVLTDQVMEKTKAN
jgi:hypothetical protein